MTHPLAEHILERKGCPIHYWEGGQPGRPWVFFTHGLCVDHHSFDPLIPAAAEKYRVLTWDVRGHGQSQPMGAGFSLALAVEDLLELMQTVGAEQAAFVGHSNGTYIMQELAFRRPEKVLALVIADGTCITWEHSAFDRWLVGASVKLMRLFPYETLKKAGLPYIAARKDVQDYTYAAYSRLSRHDYLVLAEGLTTCLHPEPGYRITQPLLLVHGAGDQTGDIAKIAPQWAAREPNCQYEVIPDARHFAPLEQPERFNQLVMDFLSKWLPS